MDQNGTIVGIVTLADADIGMQMVRDGAAAYNRNYDSVLPEQSRRLYEESEQAARRESRGIWQQIARPSAEQGGKSKPRESTNVVESPNQQAKRLNDEAYALIQESNYQAALPPRHRFELRD